MGKKKVLILCTGNSCRSQMAEALINARLPDAWEASSAGTDPTGFTHPMAVRVLQEIGINHLGRSKHTDEFKDTVLNLVITVCDDAAENCPVWLGHGARIHLGFLDPAKVSGSESEILSAFRKVRDDISRDVIDYLKNYDE